MKFNKMKFNKFLSILTTSALFFGMVYFTSIPFFKESSVAKAAAVAEVPKDSLVLTPAQIQLNETKQELISEVDKYIKRVAPRSRMTGKNLVERCDEYGVDIRLALVQGHMESHFATAGTAARTNSAFNVGAFDGHSAKTQIRNGYGFSHPDQSVEPYLKLLKKRYLVNGKTEQDLLRNFVSGGGHRYASYRGYETALRSQWKAIDKTKLTKVYIDYKNQKTKLNGGVG